MVKQKKKRLFLINPKLKYRQLSNQRELSHLLGKKDFSVSLALPTLAAYTPDNYDIKIINEDIEKIPKHKMPDIVGLTALASTSGRAYEIADWYRSKGVPVVMGGAFASFMVEETLQHADSVVVGEAEETWPECLRDFEAGKLKKIYKSTKQIEFKKTPMPRWDLVDTNKIMILGVQASRGCPYNCDFCVVTQMYGRKMRYRDVDNVIEEIKSLPSKRLFFVDDNLTINKKYARELMKKLKPLGVSWGCQSSIEIAFDEELLIEMRDAGCFNILIGFESINPESLKEANKGHNKVARYKEAIDKIHSVGINILASFVLGFDSDTLEEFDRFCEFTISHNLPFIIPNILTVTPGADLYDRMKKEGRLCDVDPSLVNGTFPCMHYYNISQIDILNKYYETIDKLISYDTIRKKAHNIFKDGHFQHKWKYDIGLWQKVRASFTILKRFYFTSNKDKVKLFKELFSFGLQGIASSDSIAVFLLSMAGFEDYAKLTKKYLKEVREKVKLVDKGPWKLQKKK